VAHVTEPVPSNTGASNTVPSTPAGAPAPRSTLVTGIGELATNDEELGQLTGAAIVLADGQVAWVGPAERAPAADTAVDVAGRAVLPGWVDSHTHLVFAGDRTAEFGARMAGEPYRAGGIAVTVEATRAATDAQLADTLRRHVAEAAAQGTTYLETKTGYGLTVADEARAAKLASAEVDEVTFLGAHLVPPGADVDEYLELVCGPMLDAVAPHVRWADVFCETGAFDADQSRAVLTAAAKRGLGLRVHGNQLGQGPGVATTIPQVPQPPTVQREQRTLTPWRGGHVAPGREPAEVHPTPWPRKGIPIAIAAAANTCCRRACCAAATRRRRDSGRGERSRRARVSIGTGGCCRQARVTTWNCGPRRGRPRASKIMRSLAQSDPSTVA